MPRSPAELGLAAAPGTPLRVVKDSAGALTLKRRGRSLEESVSYVYYVRLG